MLGFATAWLAAVARRVRRVTVITMRAGRLDLPANVTVRSVGGERGLSEPRRVALFYRHLAAVLRDERPDACVAHMIPEFSILGAPVLRPLGVPVLTWYAHPKVTMRLRLAHHLSTRMLASAPESYRYRHDKLRVLSQGIDTELFRPEDPHADAGAGTGVLHLLSVGRLSPVKDPVTLVEAVARLRRGGLDARATLVGDAPAHDRAYLEALRRRIRTHGLDDEITLAGAHANRETVRWHLRSSAHVNCAPADHSLDKAVLEAMACGRPSLTSIAAYRSTMGPWADALIFPPGDAGALADRLAALWTAGPAYRERMGADLRRRVVEGHGLEGLADRLVAEMRAVAR